MVGQPLEIVRLEARLDVGQGVVGIGQIHVPLESVELLEILERVTFHARPDAAPHDAEQVDEHPGAQHAVDVFLACGVSAHQALQRTGLVAPEVIDVHVRMLLPARVDVIHECLKGTLLLLAGQRPSGCVVCLSFEIQIHPSEQVFEPAVAAEGIAFQVEEDIAGSRRRQASQPECRFRFQRFVDRLARVAACHLHPGLFPQPFVSLDRPSLGFPLQRQRHVGQHLNGIDAASLKFLDLQFGRSGDKAKMVIRAAACIAVLTPAADIAVQFGVGIGLRLVASRHRGFKAALYQPVIRKEVTRPISLRFEVRPGHDNIDELRYDSLHLRYQIRIQAQLQNARAARFPGQFCVDDLVGPRSEVAWRVDAPEYVGPTAPAFVYQDALADNRGAIPHRGRCFVSRFPVQADVPDLDNLVTRVLQVIEIGLLVLVSACAKDIAQRVPVSGLGALTSCDRGVQSSEMRATQMTGQVGGAEVQGSVVASHVRQLLGQTD